jgi:hypothetical protein
MLQASSFCIPVQRSNSGLFNDRTGSSATSKTLGLDKGASGNPRNLLGYPRNSVRARFCVLRALHELIQNALPLIDLRRWVHSVCTNLWMCVCMCVRAPCMYVCVRMYAFVHVLPECCRAIRSLNELQYASSQPMYVCMYACMHVCMYVCAHVCILWCMQICVCMHALSVLSNMWHTCINACMHVCMLYVSMCKLIYLVPTMNYVCMYHCMYVSRVIYIHSYIHTYTHAGFKNRTMSVFMHTCIHTYTNAGFKTE